MNVKKAQGAESLPCLLGEKRRGDRRNDELLDRDERGGRRGCSELRFNGGNVRVGYPAFTSTCDPFTVVRRSAARLCCDGITSVRLRFKLDGHGVCLGISQVKDGVITVAEDDALIPRRPNPLAGRVRVAHRLRSQAITRFGRQQVVAHAVRSSRVRGIDEGEDAQEREECRFCDERRHGNVNDRSREASRSVARRGVGRAHSTRFTRFTHVCPYVKQSIVGFRRRCVSHVHDS